MTQTGGRRIPIRARIESGSGKGGNRGSNRARIQNVVRPGKVGILEGFFRRRKSICEEIPEDGLSADFWKFFCEEFRKFFCRTLITGLCLKKFSRAADRD